jgi:hypothetical protein
MSIERKGISKMGFVKRSSSNVKLTGFWNRAIGEVLTGKLLKFVPNDKDKKNPRPFYIVEAVKPAKGEQATLNIEGEKGPVAVKGGEFVGVAANWSLSNQIEIADDAGKMVQIAAVSLAENPNGGKPMIIVEVGVWNEEG